jgi:hypothetical protein
MGRCDCGDESVPKRSAKRLPPCIELECDALPSRGRRMNSGEIIPHDEGASLFKFRPTAETLPIERHL